MNFVLMFGRHEWALALFALPETLIGKLFFFDHGILGLHGRALALVALLETLIRTRIGTLIRTLIFFEHGILELHGRALALGLLFTLFG